MLRITYFTCVDENGKISHEFCIDETKEEVLKSIKRKHLMFKEEATEEIDDSILLLAKKFPKVFDKINNDIKSDKQAFKDEVLFNSINKREVKSKC